MQSPVREGKSFNQYKQLIRRKNSFYKTQGSSWYHVFKGAFVSFIYTFSLGGNIIVYTPMKGTIRKNYFNHITYRGIRQLWREIITIPSISSFIDSQTAFFPTFDRKNVRVQSVRNEHQSVYSRADTINNNINKRTKTFSIRWKY